MDKLEKISYALLAFVFTIYIFALVVGSIVLFPVGIVGLVVLTALGLLLTKVTRERLQNKEDDHYARNVEK